MDGRQLAQNVVATRFPSVTGAWLVGSCAAGTATSASDVDVLVVLKGAGAFRETSRVDGQLIELFVHTPVSLSEWFTSEASEFRCTLAHMVATGRLITGGDQAEALQVAARRHVAAGPGPRTDEALQSLRYHLSSALDDLASATDEDEQMFVAQDVAALASELELARTRTWTGRGRWRHRWLASASPEVAHGLAEGLRTAGQNHQHLVATASEVLARAGGRLQEGYRVGDGV